VTRGQWNAIYAWCWLAGMAIGYAVAGVTGALVIFFLPVAIIGAVFALFAQLGKLGIHWDHRASVRRSSDIGTGPPDGSG